MTSPVTDHELDDAAWLVGEGLGGSARTMVGQRRGSAANRQLEAARSVRPKPAVYLLAASRDGSRAWSVPARLDIGRPHDVDAAAREALQTATKVVGHSPEQTFRCHMRLAADGRWRIEGDSLGLPAALAYESWLCGLVPSVPVFATGRVSATGDVLAVGDLERKVRAALADIGDGPGLILVPEAPPGISDPRVLVVHSWRKASDAAFGPGPRGWASRLVAFSSWLTGLASLHSDRALQLLEGVEEGSLRDRDRVLYLLHRGSHLRHVGRTHEAREDHARASQIADGVRLDAAKREELDLDVRNTALDFFEFDEPIAWLRERARRPFVSLQNELMLRGTLSRALAMKGLVQEALAERRAVLTLHDQDDALARDLGRSLTDLILLAGMAKERAALDDALARCKQAGLTPSPWTTHAIVRAHVLLGHEEAVAAWNDGRTLPFALPFGEAIGCLDGQKRGRHPIASTIRAVVRALRRCGRGEEAAALAASMSVAGHGLEEWVARTCDLEGVLALRAIGRLEEAEELLDRTRTALRESSPSASRHHHRLLDGGWEDVEVELERVFY
jgi:hypothetical protein